MNHMSVTYAFSLWLVVYLDSASDARLFAGQEAEATDWHLVPLMVIQTIVGPVDTSSSFNLQINDEDYGEAILKSIS